MKMIDLLIHAGWIVPITPRNSVLTQHSLAINGDRIAAILPTEQAKQQFQAKQQLDLPNHVLMPGLINTHAHTPMNLFRGLADDLPLMEWLQQHIWPAEQALINEASVQDGTELAILEMIRSGTTCFVDHYFFHNTTADTASKLGMRACVGLWVGNVTTAWGQSEAEYFAKAIDTLENYPAHPLISWMFAPHSPYMVSPKALFTLKELAEQYNVPIQMHVHESIAEIEQSIATYQKRPLQRLAEFGLLSPQFMNVHMVHVTREEIQMVKDTGAHIVHCPESNLKLASGFAPIAEMLASGINIALGTDGAASNNDLDLFGELRTAAILAKAQSNNPTSLPASQALEMATINGAKAIGLADEIGSLEVGKAADFIAIDMNHYFTQPIYNPLSHLAYAVNRLQVSDVWIAGQHLLRDGQFTTIDYQAIVKKAQNWAEKARPFCTQASMAI